MKPNATRIPLLFLGMALVALLTFVAAAQPAVADTAATFDTTWTDGFETYTPCPAGCDPDASEYNTATYFPNPPWIHSGLRDSFVYTDQKHSGAKALKAHGLNHDYGASIAYRAVGGYPPFEIDFWARVNGDPALLPTGGHMKTVGVELGTGPTFTSFHRGLLSFTVERNLAGTITAQEIWGGYLEADESPANGVYLGDWAGNTWYHVNIKYEVESATQVRITWTLNNGTPLSRVYDVNWYENMLDYVGLWAGGGQLWYDDVRVTASTDPFFFDTPDSPFTEHLYLPLITR
jgi:hypothetical protein